MGVRHGSSAMGLQSSMQLLWYGSASAAVKVLQGKK